MPRRGEDDAEVRHFLYIYASSRRETVLLLLNITLSV